MCGRSHALKQFAYSNVHKPEYTYENTCIDVQFVCVCKLEMKTKTINTQNIWSSSSATVHKCECLRALATELRELVFVHSVLACFTCNGNHRHQQPALLPSSITIFTKPRCFSIQSHKSWKYMCRESSSSVRLMHVCMWMRTRSTNFINIKYRYTTNVYCIFTRFVFADFIRF